jgi:serine/threonine protein kinase
MESSDVSIQLINNHSFPYKLYSGDTLNSLLQYIKLNFSLDLIDHSLLKSVILYEDSVVDNLSSIILTKDNIGKVTIDLNKILQIKSEILKRKEIFKIYKNMNPNVNIIRIDDLDDIQDQSYGGLASVKKCIYKNKECILKQYQSTIENYEKYLIEEINFYANYNHSNFPNFYGIVVEKEKNKFNIGILIEYIEGKDLSKFLEEKKGQLSEKEKIEIINQIIKIVSYLHDLNIIHRDLKPNNFVIKTSLKEGLNYHKVYAIDFGSYKNLSTDLSTTVSIGCQIFCAPEYINEAILGLFTDIWSLGCIIYNVLTEKLLFRKPVDIYNWLVNNKLSEEFNSEFEQIIVKKCIDPDPYKRPYISYIENFATYYYFKKFELNENGSTIIKKYK